MWDGCVVLGKKRSFLRVSVESRLGGSNVLGRRGRLTAT